MKKLLTMLLLVLTMSGCMGSPGTNNPPPTYSPPEPSQPNIAEITRVKSELNSKGIDIEDLLQSYVDNVSDIYNLEYQLNECNLSVKSSNQKDDFVLQIRVSRSWGKMDRTITSGWIMNSDGKYTCIFSQSNKFSEYELRDLTADGCDEILLKSDNSGTGYADDFLAIYKYRNGEMAEIFNEMIDGRWPKIHDEKFDTITYESNYNLIRNDTGVYDIIFNCQIHLENLDNSNELLVSEGTIMFKFINGSYIPKGTDSYDYKKEIETWQNR